MRDLIRTAWALALLASSLATATSAAEPPIPPPPADTTPRPAETTPRATDTPALPAHTTPRAVETAPGTTDTSPRTMDAPPLPERSRPAAMAPAPAQQAAAARHAAPPLISTHQINRYDAINRLQAALKANPNSLADWVILGELSHEAALDAPRDHAAKFYQMSRDAYERALTLDPNTAGLKAAVQFARDREAGADRFEQIRDQATRTYLEARRRDLAATGYLPAVRTAAPPAPNRVLLVPANQVLSIESPPVEPSTNPAIPAPISATAPATVVAPASADGPKAADTLGTSAGPATTKVPGVGPSANAPSQGAGVAYDHPANSVIESHFGTRQIYSVTPYYQPYILGPGVPYTFQQYSNAYSPPNDYGNPAPLRSRSSVISSRSPKA